jgi:hypothetical protein
MCVAGRGYRVLTVRVSAAAGDVGSSGVFAPGLCRPGDHVYSWRNMTAILGPADATLGTLWSKVR